MIRVILVCAVLVGCGFGDNSNPLGPAGGRCGDGTIDLGEGCDDRNTTDGDGCSADCAVETVDPECGNGVREVGEMCDLGDDNGMNMGCSEDCDVESVCGNDVHEAGEACEDGNTTSGDGCSATCQIESATSCELLPQDGCEAGDACDIRDDNTTACRDVTTPGTSDSRCTVATGCEAGFTCTEDEDDPNARTCARFCMVNSDCGQLSRCAYTVDNAAGEPLNAKVCSNQCAILGQTGCPTSFGCFAIDNATDDFTHCRPTGITLDGQACASDIDCLAGSFCNDEGSGVKVCRAYCNSANFVCGAGFCLPLAPDVTINGTTYGYCFM
jgi:cysteine-rich repeat protein